MHEIRIDPLSGLRAIVATGEATPADAPLLAAGAPAPPADAHPALFTALAATGAHELIDNGPPDVVALADLTVQELQDAVELWRERMRAHAGAAYVHVCVDEQPVRGAGSAPSTASTPPTRSRAQLYALDFVPAVVARERERFSAHATRTMGSNLLEDLVQEEVRRRERIVAIDDEAVLFCPYASSGPYALTLAPRRRRERFEDDGPSGAALLHDALSRLARHFGASPPLSLWVRTAPRDAERFCWRIEILPRRAPAAGLQAGAGLQRNDVAPERAAAHLRAA
ncbi:MAG: UDPglucose--hexose-phosphate uridylyltransferase [Solirubrobacteraceae bacterium]|nr:UDPglucose--hexose-phosphate uridylyltransferase [Solirubrobacteraceae bacterium]